MNLETNANYYPDSHRRIEITRHAQKRAKQRAIPQNCVPLIKAYGERSHDGEGGIRCMMTQRSVEELGRAVGRNARIDALKGTYVVLDADTETRVITVGHRYS